MSKSFFGPFSPDRAREIIRAAEVLGLAALIDSVPAREFSGEIKTVKIITVFKAI